MNEDAPGRTGAAMAAGRSRRLVDAFAVAAVTAFLGGCASSTVTGGPASGGVTAVPTPVDAASFVRVVEAFPVLDENGNAYPQPFLGGFNIPRPQLVDIDGDSDDDLFVQEESGKVMFFERVQDGPAPFLWRTDAYQDLAIGEWYRFVDLDRDGDPDLLAEQPFSYVRYYQNVGGRTSPRFVEAEDSLEDSSAQPIFSDRQNIPNATDIDCDGRMDLFIGRLTGTVTRYEESGTDAQGAPRFQHITDRFEDIEIVAQIGSKHGANTMAWGDVDGDGDEDLFWGDYFEPGILLLENTGTCRSPSLRQEPRPFPLDDPLLTSGYNAPTLGDVDGDGAEDLLVGVLGGAYNPNTTTADNFHYLRQRNDGGFDHITSRFLRTLDVGAESVPIVVDLDGDGDQDILVGNKIEQDDTQNGKLYRLLNVGTAAEPRFRLDGALDVGGGYHLIPAFGDLDGDGDLDAIIGTWQDALRLHINDADDGSIRLTLADSAFVTLTRGRNAAPALGDIDADGDLDLFVGESSGALNFYENTGGAAVPEFTLVSDEFGDFDVGRRSFPVLRDLDADGDLDLLVGSESSGIHLFRNQGTPTAPDFVPGGLFEVDDFGFATPAFADLDGDGDDDLLLGGGRGGLWLFENRR